MEAERHENVFTTNTQRSPFLLLPSLALLFIEICCNDPWFFFFIRFMRCCCNEIHEKLTNNNNRAHHKTDTYVFKPNFKWSARTQSTITIESEHTHKKCGKISFCCVVLKEIESQNRNIEHNQQQRLARQIKIINANPYRIICELMWMSARVSAHAMQQNKR